MFIVPRWGNFSFFLSLSSFSFFLEHPWIFIEKLGFKEYWFCFWLALGFGWCLHSVVVVGVKESSSLGTKAHFFFLSLFKEWPSWDCVGKGSLNPLKKNLMFCVFNHCWVFKVCFLHYLMLNMERFELKFILANPGNEPWIGLWLPLNYQVDMGASQHRTQDRGEFYRFSHCKIHFLVGALGLC